MSKPTLTDLLNLVKHIVIPFYLVKRHSPVRAEGGRYENDAEHSWSVALVAAALAPQIDPKLDVGKICQFAIVHDLVEVHAGDTSNFADDAVKATKDSREEAALHKLKKDLPALPWIPATIKEYEAQTTIEAQFVKSVDKLLPLMFDYIEDGLFYQENKITVEEWRRQLRTHREKASKHSGAFVYYDELWNLLLANPHLFHKATGKS
ncbi:MAG TPA: HD domain-containing protein [Candidatus Saccharimonadales bacterium]|nr:HD domain-containing protein [Candidatus Saccharimonadales bacterium]